MEDDKLGQDPATPDFGAAPAQVGRSFAPRDPEPSVKARQTARQNASSFDTSLMAPETPHGVPPWAERLLTRYFVPPKTHSPRVESALIAHLYRRFRWLSLLLVLGLLAAVSALPVSRRVGNYRAERAAREALALMDAGKWQEGAAQAAAAYELRSQNELAMRAAGRALANAGNADGLKLYEELRARKIALTPDDWRAYIGLAVTLNRFDEAEGLLAEFLPTVQGGSPSDRFAVAGLAARRGRPAEAVSVAQTILANPAANGEARVNAALLILDSPLDEAHGEAWRALEELARGTELPALQALSRLALRELALPPEALSPLQSWSVANLIGGLKNHPLARQAEVLQAFDLAIARGHEPRERAIAEAGERFGLKQDEETVRTFGQWLIHQQAFERALILVPVKRAAGSKVLSLVHMDALFGLGRWADARSLVQSQRLPLETRQQDVLIAVCQTRLGEPKAAANRWNRVLAAAAGRPPELLAIAAICETHGATEAARQAFRDAVTTDPTSRIAWLGLLRLAETAGDTRAAWVLLGEMGARFPNDAAVRNDHAYLSALLGEDLEKSEQNAAAAVEDRPRDLRLRATLALARLRLGRKAEAAGVFIGTALEDARALEGVSTPASTMAVRVAVFAANGQLPEAGALARLVPNAKLRPEERALVQTGAKP